MDTRADNDLSDGPDMWPLTAREVAETLGLSERTVRRAIARGVLRAEKKNGVYRVTRVDVERYRTEVLYRSASPLRSLPRLWEPRVVTLAHATPKPGSSIPVPPTPLIDRDAEVAMIQAALIRQEGADATRLLTLTGPGGVGKTRLALRVAAEAVSAFRDGVWFISLVAVADGSGVARAIAETVGIHEAGGRPISDVLRAFLQAKHLPLVLDTFEHVLSAAPLISDLIAACPKLAILVTSREVLRLQGERILLVPPLALPDHVLTTAFDLLQDAPAVRLFVERATATRSDFALTLDNAVTVATICQRVDGLPLAIELAAALSNVLPPAALLARLDRPLPLLTAGSRDNPDRFRTLRETIAWSYDLLSAEERRLFRRLSVFIGGFTLEAAEFVGGEEPEDTGQDTGNETTRSSLSPASPTTLDLVKSLRDKSLLRSIDKQTTDTGADARFDMLDTIREFGREQLVEYGELDIARTTHMAWCQRLAARAEREWTGPLEGRWFDRIDQELGNVRSAIAWAMDRDEAELGLRLTVSLWRFWGVRGHLRDTRNWLERFLALPSASAVPLSLRGVVLNGLCNLALDLSDYDTAQIAGEESLSIRRELGDRVAIADTLHNLATLAACRGDFAQERALLHEARALRKEIGSPRALADTMCRLGGAINSTGDHAQARSLLDEALVMLEVLGDVRGVAYTRCFLGEVERDEGAREQARNQFEQSLVLMRTVGDRRGIGIVLHHLADLAIEDDTPMATTHFVEALRLRWDLGDRRGMVDDLIGIATIAAINERWQRAALLIGAAEALQEVIATPLPRREQERKDHIVAQIETELGAALATAVRSAGSAMPLERAIAEAEAEAETSLALPVSSNPMSSVDPLPGVGVDLTPRELDVLRLLAEGKPDRDIAAALFISRRTASTHVTTIFRKIGVSSRAAAAAYAVRRGIA